MTRLLRFALLASLALNLSLGVGMAWLVLRPLQEPASSEADRSRPMFRHDTLRRALSQERASLVDTVMARHRDAMHAHMEQLRATRLEVREAIRAEPFERDRLDAAFAHLREADQLTATEAHALLGDLVAGASPAERQRLAQLFSGQRGRHGAREPRAPSH